MDELKDADEESQELTDDAFNLLKETPNLKKIGIQEVRGNFSSTEVSISASDAEIVGFLRGKNYDVSAAVQSIENRFKFRREHHGWFRPFTASEIAEAKVMMAILEIELLESRDKFGRMVVVIRQGRLVRSIRERRQQNIAAFSLSLIRFNIWLLDRISEHRRIQVYGLTLLNCFGGLESIDSIRTLPTLLPLDEAKHLITYATRCCALRLKDIYIFDEPFYFKMIWKVVRVFISEKVRSRFHFCGIHHNEINSILESADIPDHLGGQRKYIKSWLLQSPLLMRSDSFDERFFDAIPVPDSPGSRGRRTWSLRSLSSSLSRRWSSSSRQLVGRAVIIRSGNALGSRHNSVASSEDDAGYFTGDEGGEAEGECDSPRGTKEKGSYSVSDRECLRVNSNTPQQIASGSVGGVKVKEAEKVDDAAKATSMRIPISLLPPDTSTRDGHNTTIAAAPRRPHNCCCCS